MTSKPVEGGCFDLALRKQWSSVIKTGRREALFKY
jgi:hypothetical protein